MHIMSHYLLLTEIYSTVYYPSDNILMFITLLFVPLVIEIFILA